MSVTYIVDDQDPAIEYLCQVLHQPRVTDNYFRNTYTTIATPDCGGGWFKYSFNGTSVMVSNRLMPAEASYAIQIDISPMLQYSENGVYQSPELEDGKEHSIVYAVGNQSSYPAFDYLTVTAGPSTQLRGRTIIVDDTDSAIEYTGNWRTQPITPSAMNFDYTSSPYKDTTTWSNTVGDSLTYNFEGTSIAVYGVIPASNATVPNRNLTAIYSIDGGQSNILSLSPGNEGRPIAVVELLRSDDLTEGKHKMVLTVSDIPNLSLSGVGIDFITYNASFDNLSSIGAGVVPSSAGAINNGGTPIWQPVLGAVLGLLALLLTSLLGLFYWRKRKQNNKGRAKATPKVFVIPTLKDGQIVDEKYGKSTLTPDV